ncbi:hypothetical protein QBC39DRAFT_360954 [Podospora conica]|nr:hypothetical protein QBC39DRAFT_360954 [Schizothecium conicum]
MHMCSFKDGGTISIELWRTDPLPVVKDLVMNRSPLDRIIQVGGFISANTGSAPEANSVPAPRDKAIRAFNVASCIIYAARLAACPNRPVSIFLGVKITYPGGLPLGQMERWTRVVDMVAQNYHETFCGYTNIVECTVACPKKIPVDVIS